MVQAVSEELIEPIKHTIIQVIMTMTGILPTPSELLIKQDIIAQGDVTGVMTMQSPDTSGSLALSFSKELLFEMAKRMFGEDISEVDESICDLAGEMTNMVVGGTKHMMEEKGYDFDMSTPQVSSGKEHTIEHPFGTQTYSMEFRSQPGPLYLEINFSGE